MYVAYAYSYVCTHTVIHVCVAHLRRVSKALHANAFRMSGILDSAAEDCSQEKAQHRRCCDEQRWALGLFDLLLSSIRALLYKVL